MKIKTVHLAVGVPDNGKDHVIQVAIIENDNKENLPDQPTNIYRFGIDIPATSKTDDPES